MRRLLSAIGRHFLAVLVIGTVLVPSYRANAKQAPGSVEMVEILDRVQREANPRRNPYLNDRRLQQILEAREGSAWTGSLPELLELGAEAVRAGRTELGVETLEQVVERVDRGESAGGVNAEHAKHELGIAYLRLAEKQNCAGNPSLDRCLLPLRGGGVHSHRLGGEKALALYSELALAHPEELAYRWLANLAAQYLGSHPAELPESVRIPVAAYEAGSDFPRFPDIAPEVGLDTLSLAGGAIADDFDNDGDLDIVASSWGLEDQVRIFWNERGSFVDGTDEAGLTGLEGGLNLVQADADGDGRLDFLILRGAWMREEGRHPNSLVRNLGRRRFEDVTVASGLLSFHPTQTGAWSDFDGDGDLDLFVGNETVDVHPHPSELWRNRGDGSFEEISAEVGIFCDGYVKGVIWEDVDDDGRPDLYVSDLQGPNWLYLNRGEQADGGWRFEEVAVAAGVTQPRVSFPVAFLDFDQDGRSDLWVSGYRAMIAEVAAEYLGRETEPALLPRLYRNLGGGRFEDVTESRGMATVLATMGLGVGDLDNDGFPDLYAATGNTPLETILPNRMFHNRGGRGFEDVTVAGGFGHLQKGHAVAFADLDQDGDQDVFAVLGGAHPADTFWNALFENPGFGHAWVRLELEGRKSNHFAVGARVAVVTRGAEGERTFWRTVGVGGSFGANPLRLEMGLGRAHEISEVRVRWPRLENGQPVLEVFTKITPAASWKLVEGTGVASPLSRPPIPFRKSPRKAHAGH